MLYDPIGLIANLPQPLRRRIGLTARRWCLHRYQPLALAKPLEQLLRPLFALACFLIYAIDQAGDHRGAAAVLGHGGGHCCGIDANM